MSAHTWLSLRHWSLQAKLTAVVLLVALLPVVLLAGFAWRQASDFYRHTAEMQDRAHLKRAVTLLDRATMLPPHDLRLLAASHDLGRFLLWQAIGEQSEAARWLQSVQNTFRAFMESNRQYMQLRLIGGDGRELVRIERRTEMDEPHAITGEALQWKGDRPYFTETMKLPRGAIYSSPLDLNREHGRIQTPHTPVLRFATPLIDSNGTRHGVLVLNMFAGPLLDRLEALREDDTDFGREEHDRFYLINRQGFYLAHPDREQRFGFDLGLPAANARIAQPLLWAKMQQQVSGHLDTPDGLVHFFTRAWPVKADKSRFWFVVHGVPRAEHLAGLARFRTLFLIAMVVLVALLIAISRPLIRSMVDPIRRLTDNMARLEQGRTNLQPIEYHGHDEIGAMIDAAQGLGRRIVEAIDQTKAIAQGDFRARIAARSPEDELGIALQSMTVTLRHVAAIASAIARGNLAREVRLQGEHDQLGRALQAMVQTMRETVARAEEIARGDFQTAVTPRSDDDRIGRALAAMTRTLRATADIADSLAEGRYDIEVAIQGERDRLGRALAHLAEVLRTNEAEHRANDWLRSTLVELGGAMQGQPDVAALAAAVTPLLARALGAPCGLLFVCRELPEGGAEHAALCCVGQYACDDSWLGREVAMGEGVVGQCARDRRQLCLDHLPTGWLPTDRLRARSGLGEAEPGWLLAQPLLADGAPVGVIELALFHAPTAIEQELLRQASPLLAAAIRALLQAERNRALLEESQAMTEELQAQEEELREANAALEMKSEALEHSSRQLEEQTEALKQQAAALEQASRYKSEFLANMSHELRTPLNSMLILAEMLANDREGRLSDKQREYARTILHSGRELLELINGILDLAKVEAGRMEVDPRPFNPSETVEALRRDFAHVAEQAGLTLRLERADALPAEMVSDEPKLKQILKNLLANACKFTDRGGTVTLILDQPDPDHLRFAVRDSGIGIEPEKLEQIFEAFRQADGSTSRKYGGTGLGLSICRELARLLRGTIAVESTPGAGSCFALTLPVAAFDAPAGQREPAAIPPRPEASTTSEAVAPMPTMPLEEIPNPLDDDRARRDADHRPTVLIVEDDADFAGVLQQLVREHGMQTLCALRGDHALALAAALHPDALLLDLNLPDIDGAELLTRLRRLPRCAAIPVHVISCRDDDEERRRLQQQGVRSWLRKPAERDQLEQMLRQMEAVLARDLGRLLVVEDDPAQSRALCALLEEHGVEVELVGRGEEALDYLRHHQVDCMILDLNLPDIGGEELLRRMEQERQAINGGNPVPVILHTAEELPPEVAERIQRNVHSIIIKGTCASERLLAETRLFLHHFRHAGDQPRATEDGTELAGHTVLLVDDDIRNIFSLSGLLEEAGMRVLTARNGREAIAQIEAQGEEIELVLMDVMMPEMDGLEAMRRIRAMERFRDLPIVALTAKAMAEDRAQCMAAGATDFISKPVDTGQLRSLIRVWLHG
ncbi:MAG: response regulator [Zetaproteobacteria bacterium]|nr:MAG: response regulator [Zetaproteobacteria bacterium]